MLPFNKLLEIYSGHGNSEEYRPWAPMEVQNDETLLCNQPSQSYVPDCFQAGEIIRERCRVSAGSDEECNKRAIEARQIFVSSNPLGVADCTGIRSYGVERLRSMQRLLFTSF